MSVASIKASSAARTAASPKKFLRDRWCRRAGRSMMAMSASEQCIDSGYSFFQRCGGPSGFLLEDCISYKLMLVRAMRRDVSSLQPIRSNTRCRMLLPLGPAAERQASQKVLISGIPHRRCFFGGHRREKSSQVLKNDTASCNSRKTVFYARYYEKRPQA